LLYLCTKLLHVKHFVMAIIKKSGVGNILSGTIDGVEYVLRYIINIINFDGKITKIGQK
jgi:hypothetical protein